MAPIRYVDPHQRRGCVYRAWCRFSAAPVGLWLSEHVAWKLDPLLLKLTGGRLGCSGPIASGVLESHGARSGKTRTNAVLYFHDRDRITVVASRAGASRHPAWYFNLLANPEVRFAGQPFRAVVIEDEDERQRLWELADRVFPPFAQYRQRAARADRAIPLVQLIPRSP